VFTSYSGNVVTVTDQAGKQRRSYTDALGRLIQVDEPGPAAGGGGTPGTGSVNITGTEQSVTVSEYVGDECVLWFEGNCVQWQPVYQNVTYYDAGGVSITVNGFTKSVSYANGSTGTTIASALASAFNGDGASPVTASSTGAVVYLTSKVGGAASNYSLSATSWTNDPAPFSAPSFVPVRSGPTLTGGTDGPPGSGPLSLSTPTITTYTYDTLGNLTNVLQGGSRPRTFVYNSLSQLLSATNPESGTISYTYDADGNLLTKVSPAPNQTNPAVTVTTTFKYDVLHRLNQKSYSDATPLVKYSYDGVAYLGCTSALSTVNSIGRRTAMCDGAGQESSSYDALGRVLTDRRTTNSITKDFSYAYNLDSSLWKLTYPSGRIIEYHATGAGRSDWAKDVANSINYALTASYGPSGALSSLQNGANIVSTFYYNTRLQPCRISVKSSGTVPINCADATNVGNVLDFTYGFNAGTANNGNVASILNNRNHNRDQSFTYDELNRIKSAVSGATSGQDCWGQLFGHMNGGTYVSGFDIWANLKEITPDPSRPGCSVGTLGLTINTLNRIADTGFSYDAAGNLNAEPQKTYTYDAENRMTQSVVSGVTATYVYDGDGKRLKKSSGKLYWYGVGSDPTEESDLTGVASADYIFFNGKRTARLDLPSAAVHYYFANHLGSTSIVTSNVGVIQDESDYYPFGGERVVTDTDPNQYKFTGKERDTESGLDFFIARYYSSGYGRFLSPDEFAGGPVDAFSSGDPLPPDALPYADITDPQSLNKHAYTLNNPLRYIDLEGHDGFDFVLGVINAVGSNGIGAGRQESYNSDHATGQAVGDVISLGVGLVEMAIGSTAAGGGAVACGTGVGCIAGAPVAVAGVTLGVHGVSMAANGIISLAKSIPNPFGMRGAPDHQAKVKELNGTAKGEAKPGQTVEANKKIKGHQSNRKPDVQIVDAKGRTIKVFEAERHPNRTRNIKREKEYKKLRIPNETHPLK